MTGGEPRQGSVFVYHAGRSELRGTSRREALLASIVRPTVSRTGDWRDA